MNDEGGPHSRPRHQLSRRSDVSTEDAERRYGQALRELMVDQVAA